MKVLIDDKIQTYSADEIARWTALLPQWRRERVEAIKHDAGRRQSLLAFRLLCQGLREEYDIAELPPFSFNEHNKPHWDEGLALPHFSLSHCREAAACVIDERPCGIDIESRGRKVSDSLIRYAMNDEERAAISQAEDSALAFLRLWTRKEAVLKLIGTGIRDTMKDVLRDCPYDVETRETEHYVLSIATHPCS
ncbi:MAG: 4'-phosphopantetheinyl transferase superfamily protein [Bacteroidaceae bacterium]|nr:4'-phosphopantetheinyl transferase superfamily protein [Bacteroidaceae bacterium]